MRKYIVAMAMAIFLSLCSQTCVATETMCIISNQIDKKTVKELTQLYDFSLYGTGGSCYHGVRSFWLGFTIDKPLSIDEARKLAICCVEIYHRNINSDPEVRPYLIQYPFPRGKAEISIEVIDTKAKSRKANSLVFVTAKSGSIRFTIENAKGEPDTYHIESWDEAVQIVREGMHCGQEVVS